MPGSCGRALAGAASPGPASRTVAAAAGQPGPPWVAEQSPSKQFAVLGPLQLEFGGPLACIVRFRVVQCQRTRTSADSAEACLEFYLIRRLEYIMLRPRYVHVRNKGPTCDPKCVATYQKDPEIR